MSSAVIEQNAQPVVARPVPQDLYRLLLLRKDGSELLVAGDQPPFALPCVQIPRWERVAEKLNSAVENSFGIPAVCMFMPSPPSTEGRAERRLYQLLETRVSRTTSPAGMSWAQVNSLSAQSFAESQDFAVLTEALRQLRDFQSGKVCGPFAKLGWIEEVSSWLQHVIESQGFRLTGEFRQVHASPTFALLRFETNRQALWFKAVDEPNLQEVPISILLSQLFPSRVPRVIATHSGWHAWVTEECPGLTLEESSGAEAWEMAAKGLARLQIESLGRIETILEAGCRDLRIHSLLDQVDPFFEVMNHLMEEQRTVPPPILSEGQLARLKLTVKAALSALAQLRIPDAIGHLDFNPGNILLSTNQCVILDWCEAYVGNPILTLEYLRAHLLRLQRTNLVLHSSLAACYAAEWSSSVDAVTFAKAQQVTPLLAVFAYALSLGDWKNLKQLNPARAAYFRSLTRRMNAENVHLEREKI